jgi:hypothetical protein
MGGIPGSGGTGGKDGLMGAAKGGMTPAPMQAMQGKLPLPPGINIILGAMGKESPSMPGIGGAKGGKGGGSNSEEGG